MDDQALSFMKYAVNLPFFSFSSPSLALSLFSFFLLFSLSLSLSLLYFFVLVFTRVRTLSAGEVILSWSSSESPQPISPVYSSSRPSVRPHAAPVLWPASKGNFSCVPATQIVCIQSQSVCHAEGFNWMPGTGARAIGGSAHYQEGRENVRKDSFKSHVRLYGLPTLIFPLEMHCSGRGKRVN